MIFSIPLPVRCLKCTTNSDGYYAFNGVIPGTYSVSEVTPSYTVASTTIQTTVNTASTITNNGNKEIQVTVKDPSTQSITAEWTGGFAWSYVNIQLNPTSDNAQAPSESVGPDQYYGPFPVTLTGTTNDPYTGSVSYIGTLCSDLFQSVKANQTFTLTPSQTPSTTNLPTDQTNGSNYATNYGELGYLYNTYGTTPTARKVTPPIAMLLSNSRSGPSNTTKCQQRAQ